MLKTFALSKHRSGNLKKRKLHFVSFFNSFKYIFFNLNFNSLILFQNFRIKFVTNKF